MSLILGSGACVLGRARHLPTAPRYHPECKGGGQGASEYSPKRDANRQSWEKVNKGHAPCRRPAGAHPPLRPSPVHFHSSSSASSPAGLPRNPKRLLPPTPSTHPSYLGCVSCTHLGRLSPAPQKEKKKTTNLCNASEPRNRACCPRVQRPRAPSLERGRRAEAVAPGRCLGLDRLHVSPARGRVHRLSPVWHPDVLRINKMKLGETEGQIAPGFRALLPSRSASPPRTLVAPQPLGPAGAREATCSPSTPTRPRPLAGPGALCRSH